MKLRKKNESPHGGWFFYYISPKTKAVVQVPPGDRPAGGLHKLTALVRNAFLRNKIEVPPNLQEYVEHQICLRQPDPKAACWNSGVGDAIHHYLAKPLAEAASRTLERHGAPTAARRVRGIGGCAGCGGTKVYDPAKKTKNLGRAGKLNRLAPNRNH